MKLNKKIITVMSAVCALFLAVIVYLTYFTLFSAKDIVNSSYNQRIWEKEEKVLRGSIFDRKGTRLAYSEETDDGQKRVYPFNELYAHSIGYNSRQYGKTNLELNFNDYLLQTKSVIDVIRSGDKDGVLTSKGANLELTLDHSMTKLAQELMGGANGSVVAMNPVTGETYCMYSNPSFDPNDNKLTENWKGLAENEASPFVSRATGGLYAPGSTFKIITSAAAIEAGQGDFTMNDEGKIVIDGMEIKNASSKKYGEIGMKEAFKYSSNVYYSKLAGLIGSEALGDMAEKFYIGKKIPYDISTQSVETDFSDMSETELAATGIGQGKLLVTPLHMTLAACAVANEGMIMKPYMVNKAYFDDGGTVYKHTSEVLSKAMRKSTADTLKEYMVECVKSGTGTGARVSGVTVAGKTGTAENEKEGKTHAWFVGFAPAENPQIAICVMKEYSGRGGGSVCAPVAAKLISYAINNNIIQ